MLDDIAAVTRATHFARAVARIIHRQFGIRGKYVVSRDDCNSYNRFKIDDIKTLVPNLAFRRAVSCGMDFLKMSLLQHYPRRIRIPPTSLTINVQSTLC